MQYTRPDKDKASEMMWDTGMGGGSSYVMCSCNKEHTLPDDFPEEQYDWGNFDSINFIDLDNQQFVYGCEGCDKRLAKYENFIWQNRDHIRRYLKTRIDQEKAWADQEHILNIVAGF